NLVCPTILFGEEFARHSQTEHIYSYRLMQPIPVPGMAPLPKWMGVTHAQDQVYLFMSQTTTHSMPHLQLSQDMIHAWTAFAKTGKPSKLGSSVVWEKAVDGKIHDFSTKYIHLESG